MEQSGGAGSISGTFIVVFCFKEWLGIRSQDLDPVMPQNYHRIVIGMNEVGKVSF